MASTLNKKTIQNYLPSFLVNSQTYSVVITDLQSRYIYVNNIYKKRFSFIHDSFTGEQSFITIFKEDHHLCLDAVHQIIADPDKVVAVELRKPDADTLNFYWTSWEFSAYKDENNSIIGILCIGHDITETERASRRANIFAKKVENIIEDISDGLIQVSKSWKFTMINTVAEQMFNLPKEKVIGKNFWDFFPSNDTHKYNTQFSRATESNTTVTFEEYLATSGKWIRITAYPSNEGLSIFFRDITERENYLDTIKKQQEMLHAIYQSTIIASTFVDKNFIIRYCNQVSKDITKSIFGKEVQFGDHFLEYIVPAYKDEFKLFLNRVIQGETIKVERQNGDKWWEISMYPVLDESGVIIGLAHNVFEITDRVNRTLKLSENEERFSKVIEAIPHPFLILDSSYTIQRTNIEFEEVFGYKNDEVVGKNVDFLIPKIYRKNHHSLQNKYMKEGGKSMKMGNFLPAIIKDGSEIFVQSSINTFSVSGTKNIVVIFQDVTKAKEHQDTIVRQNESLQSIAWHQSHILRAPVSRVLGLCDLLNNHLDEDYETNIVYINYILKSIQEIDEIIRKIDSDANLS